MPETPHDIACRLAKTYRNVASLSEADTRHQIIDEILHGVLSWPRASVVCEPYIDPGYADYVLLGRPDSCLLFLEAKKEGSYFHLPAPFDSGRAHGMIKAKTLMTAEDVKRAMVQVQTYCITRGCEFAAVTNGHQWVFFKVFERNTDWREIPAFFIRSLDYFADCFAHAIDAIGYRALSEDASLAQLLGKVQMQRRERFFPKAKIPEFNQEVHNNYLATCMRPLANRYLGKMTAADDDFMERCYVNVRDYHASITRVTQIIKDCLTPYFKNYNVREFFDDSQGGEFGKRIASHLRERRTREVIVLFGGKGAGKSTFVWKLLHHRPPREIVDHSVIAVVDLLECPEDQAQINDEVWHQLLQGLDGQNLLSGGRDVLLSLFSDRYAIAQKQVLAGLAPASDAYNVQLNALVKEWLA
jgi:predicted type IV restriction endonuclease